MREHWFCLKDCLHQLVHQPTRTTTNGGNGSEERTRPFAAIFEHLQTTANSLSLLYKEGAAGSNPAWPTLEKAELAGKTRERRRIRTLSQSSPPVKRPGTLPRWAVLTRYHQNEAANASA